MAGHLSSLSKTKHYSTRPNNTLSVVLENSNTFISRPTDTRKEHRTEKSVRFASESESLSDDKSEADSVHSSGSSGGIITWVPSEQLYNDDTFISESPKENISDDSDTVKQTDPSFGTNTFIDFESEDETKTFSEYSYTDSFVSSDVFSSNSQSDNATSREWRDVTEIVKDIEELAESEFVNKFDLLQLATDQNSDIPNMKEETDITVSEDGETVDVLKQNFLLDSVRRLRLKELQSPRNLDQQFQQMWSARPPTILGQGDQEEAAFYHQMIASCCKSKASPAHVEGGQENNHQVLEYYGISSGIVEKLKTINFQHQLKKKLADLERETELSLEYIRNNQHINDMREQQQFINHIRACVLKDNITECIQTHLIKMHPVEWFSRFVTDLPRLSEDSREILHMYKKQVENRIQKDNVCKENSIQEVKMNKENRIQEDMCKENSFR